MRLLHRPIIASLSDKVDLQQCLEIGRQAKVNRINIAELPAPINISAQPRTTDPIVEEVPVLCVVYFINNHH